MSFCVELDVKDQLVLLIGGGKVALRKAMQLREEGAVIHVIAPSIEPALQAIARMCEKRQYCSADLHPDIFLVIGATDDPTLNHQIITDARLQHLLAMSVHKDEQATLHAMMQRQKEHYALAVSTKGHYPLLASVILDQFAEIMEETYAARIAILAQIRAYLYATSLARETISSILRKITALSEANLSFLLRALQQQKACVLVFHGVARSCVITDILHSLAHLQDQSGLPFTFAFMSATICQQLEEQERPFACTELFSLCNELQIKLIVFPMFIQKGQFYRKLSLLTAQYDYPMAELPFASAMECSMLVEYLAKQKHRKETEIIIALHASEDQQFFQLISACMKQFPHMSCCYEQDLLPKQQDVQIYLLVMLLGKHATSWQDQVISCFADPYLKDLIMKKITRFLRELSN